MSDSLNKKTSDKKTSIDNNEKFGDSSNPNSSNNTTDSSDTNNSVNTTDSSNTNSSNNADDSSDTSASFDTSDIDTSQYRLTREEQKIGFRCMLISAVFAVIGGQVFAGNILWLIVLNLGGKENYIGLLSFLIFAVSILQASVVSIAQRVHRKKYILTTFTLSFLATIPILFVKKISIIWGTSVALAVLAICVTLRQSAMQITMPAWMGLLRAVTPEHIRGTLLGKLRMSWQSMIVFMLILTGLYLGHHPDWHRLKFIIYIAFVAQIIRILVLLPVKAPPIAKSKNQLPWLKMIISPVKDIKYRPFLLYVIGYGLALGMAEPFRIIYLIRLGFGENVALISASFVSLGAVVTLMLWGKLADKFGNRAVFTLTLIGLAITTLLWTIVSYLGLIFAILLFLAVGAFNFGNGLVQTRYMFSSLKPELDASYIAITYILLQFSVGLGSLVGGQILVITHNMGFVIGKSFITNYHFIFILSFMIFLVPFYIRKKLTEPTDIPTRYVLTSITQPLRSLVGPLLFWPKNDNNNEKNSNINEQ